MELTRKEREYIKSITRTYRGYSSSAEDVLELVRAFEAYIFMSDGPTDSKEHYDEKILALKRIKTAKEKLGIPT